VRLDTELLLVLGIAVAVLAIPAIISSFSSSRAPRAAIIAAVTGGGMILAALSLHPGGYRAQDLPAIAKRVAERYLH
jgi:hypothetical protein